MFSHATFYNSYFDFVRRTHLVLDLAGAVCTCLKFSCIKVITCLNFQLLT